MLIGVVGLINSGKVVNNDTINVQLDKRITIL